MQTNLQDCSRSHRSVIRLRLQNQVKGGYTLPWGWLVQSLTRGCRVCVFLFIRRKAPRYRTALPVCLSLTRCRRYGKLTVNMKLNTLVTVSFKADHYRLRSTKRYKELTPAYKARAQYTTLPSLFVCFLFLFFQRPCISCNDPIQCHFPSHCLTVFDDDAVLSPRSATRRDR